MNNYRQLAPGAYLVAFLLVFIPLIDASLSLAPWHLGSSQWRFGAFGLLSNALMIPAAGALIAVAAAVAAGQVRMVKVLAIFCWFVVVVLVVSTVLFSLDAMQSRRMIRPEMALSYYVASATAMGKLVLGMLSFIFLARGSRLDRTTTREATAPIRAFGKRDMASP
jgi:heme/copper-type cytochrome/quinol oxidase subunit 2